MVQVRAGGVMSVDIQSNGQQLRHDAVVGDQGGQTGVNLQETLKMVLT